MENNRTVYCSCADNKVSADCDIHRHGKVPTACKFCGAGLRKRNSYSTWTAMYQCRTGYVADSDEWYRNSDCYETELSNLKVLAQELAQPNTRCPVHKTEMILVRREDLEVVKNYYGQLLNAAFWSDDKAKIDRLKISLDQGQEIPEPERGI